MYKKANFRKISLVLCITLLIWFWADQAKTEDFSVSGASISIAKSTNQNFWVTFQDDKSSVAVNRIVLRGPTSKIAEVKRKLNDGSLKFEFFLDPEQQGMTSERTYPLSVLEFLRKTDQIKKLGLSVENVRPEQFAVEVVALEQKTLNIKCIDNDQNPVKDTVIEPPQVEALVPKVWQGEKLTALVQLTESEISQARTSAIEKTPYIIFAPGQTREASAEVKVSTPRKEDIRKPDTIKKVVLGFIFSAITEGKFKVEVENLTEVMNPIAVKTTSEAKRAYENMPYQVILEIRDEDGKATEHISREIIYNFPDEYLRKDEIILNQQPVNVRFKLTPIFPEEPADVETP